jgi:hypothetical protein
MLAGRNWQVPSDRVWIVVETHWEYDDEHTWVVSALLDDRFYPDEASALAACRRLCQSVTLAAHPPASPRGSVTAAGSATGDRQAKPDPEEALRDLLHESHRTAPYSVQEVDLALLQAGANVPARYPLTQS